MPSSNVIQIRDEQGNAQYPITEKSLVIDSIQDVTVDGTSVVDNNGVAVIPAIPDEVEANPTVPAGTTPTNLLNLKVGNDYYGVPQVAGIDEVEQTVASQENGGINTVRITLTNGDHYDVHIKNGKASAGLFPDAASLASARPSPNVGDYAFVGSGFPADIYVCQTAGTWTDSGDDYDGDNVDLTDYPKIGPGDADLEIVDENGNIIMELEEGQVKTKFFDSSLVFDPSKKSMKGTAATFVSGDSITIQNVPNVRNKYILSFCAEVSAIGTLTIKYGGTNLYASGVVKIDGTNVSALKWGFAESSTNGYEIYAHGLTFSEYIEVIIKTTETNQGHITVLTTGGRFEHDIPWAGSSGNIVASVADSGSFTNAELTMAYYGYCERLWIFGDSWADMWPVEMEKLGAPNYLLDGFSGREQTEGVNSFLLGLNFGKPSFLLWMIGMNNPERSQVEYDQWKASFDYLLGKCNELGIQLIGCTIPDGTTRVHTQKNAYIKSCGIRYIDLAAAVGCATPGSTGYAGVMMSDQVHPTEPVGSMKVSLFLLEEINNIIR